METSLETSFAQISAAAPKSWVAYFILGGGGGGGRTPTPTCTFNGGDS